MPLVLGAGITIVSGFVHALEQKLDLATKKTIDAALWWKQLVERLSLRFEIGGRFR